MQSSILCPANMIDQETKDLLQFLLDDGFTMEEILERMIIE